MAPNSPGRQSVPLVGEVNVLLPRVLVCVCGGAGGLLGARVKRWEGGGRWEQRPFTHSWLLPPERKVRPLPCLFLGQFDFPPESVEAARQWGFKLAGRPWWEDLGLSVFPDAVPNWLRVSRPVNPKDPWVWCPPPPRPRNRAGSLWSPDPGR